MVSIPRQTNLRFELCAIAPILALGYGRSCCPELSVRLVRHISQVQAKAKASALRARRASLHSSEMLGSVGQPQQWFPLQCQGFHRKFLSVSVSRSRQFSWMCMMFHSLFRIGFCWSSSPLVEASTPTQWKFSTTGLLRSSAHACR